MVMDDGTQAPLLTLTPTDERMRLRLTDKQRRALALSGSFVGVVIGPLR